MFFSIQRGLSLFFLLFLPFWALSQITIKGNIKDKETGEVIEAAYVFIANTNIGTISDAKGNFILEAIPVGKAHIVISHLNYQGFTKELSFVQSAEYNWNIKLKPAVFDLKDISVTAKKSKKRERYIKKFTKAFLGPSDNAKLCHIRNIDVLRFKEKDRQLTATANDLLQIDNFALGYRVYFYLEKFKLKDDQLSYAGKPLFEELIPKSTSQQKLWQKNRITSYRGSLQHFYQSVIDENTEEEGFKVYKASLNANKKFDLSSPINIKTLVNDKPELKEKWLVIPDFLKVVYTLEKDKITPSNTNWSGAPPQLGRPAEREMMLQGSSGVSQRDNYQHSYLYSLRHLIQLDADAYPLKATQIKEYGYWSYERIAELLPKTYRTAPVKVKKIAPKEAKKDHPKLNGFELSNLLIPLKEIKKGGPPKDGIPSIDHPKFLATDQVKFLQEKDEVLSLIINDTARAYPIKILNYHEIVNDQIGDVPILVSYCPLCGSGIVFSGKLAQRKRSFGVSGLLYNSDVLLYDRETESLWSQIMGQAISGKESGQKLEVLASNISTWETWKKQYPKGQVLSAVTGFIKDYSKNPYAAYEASDRLMFPVNQEDKSLARKDIVLGIAYQGKYKAYPLKRLKRKKSPVVDHWEGQEIHIEFDTKLGTISATDKLGQPLIATRMYWFAWFAFHPDTVIYQ